MRTKPLDGAYDEHSPWWLVALLGTTALLGYCAGAHGQTASLRNDQTTATQCSKRELRQWKRDVTTLSQSDLEWIAKGASLEVKDKDLTGDGINDHLLIIGTQYLRDCDFKKDLPYKEVVGTFTDGRTGRRQLWNWTGGLPTRMTVTPKNHEVVVYSQNYDGSVSDRTLHYEVKP